MKIAVGSINPAKLEAVKQAFKAVWFDKSWEVVGVEVKSGVSNQPMSDQESIKGARRRARKALKLTKADFGVGIEGGLEKVGKNWFDSGWVVVVSRKGQEGVASSIRMHTPPKMMKLVKKGKELGEVDDLVFKKQNSKQAEGHFGLMTKGVVSRTAGYKDGVVAALARFIHPKLFDTRSE